MNNTLKILVAGKGGREHALAQALSDSPSRPELFAYPGSDGMHAVAPCLPVSGTDQLFDHLKQESFDLCVVGPEQYLAEGWADRCRAMDVRAWGAGVDGVRLETSKSFAKDFMRRHGIPTACSTLAQTADEVRTAVDRYPCVLKFDGLAAGKGVSICHTEEDVARFIERVFVERRFGDGAVLVEEFLEGPEVSIIAAVSDGDWHLFPPARDYKRLMDDDLGPNTGGMGAVASQYLLTDAELARIEKEIVFPTLEGLRKDSISYRGFLYFGLMLTFRGPMMLEFNCRFGDPEAQAILPLVEGDFAEYLYEAAGGTLNPDRIRFADGWSVCVVAAAGSYPESSGQGDPITGLDQVRDARVYHAGTRLGADGAFETDGGRILCVSARGKDRDETVRAVYEDMARIDFRGRQYRRDIGRLHFEQGESVH